MFRAGAGISHAKEATRAVAEATAMALGVARLERADAALLFATPEHGPHLPQLAAAAEAELGTGALVGATARTVLGAGREPDGGPAVALLALGNLEAHAFGLPDALGAEERVGPEVAARIGGAATERDLVVVLADALALAPGPLLSGLEKSLAPGRIVGAGATPAASEQPLLCAGRSAAPGGVVGVVLRAPRPPRVAVTQSCRLVTDPLTVTRVEGHWISELDGRPALDVYREVARGPLAGDLRRAANVLLVALPRGQSGGAAGWVVRHVSGFARGRRAFAVPEPVGRGDLLALALHDPDGVRENLKNTLDGLAGRRPGCGLYFGCSQRGNALFGFPGLEAAYLAQALGDAPIAGMFGSCEIGPLAGRTELLTYAAVLALLDE